MVTRVELLMRSLLISTTLLSAGCEQPSEPELASFVGDRLENLASAEYEMIALESPGCSASFAASVNDSDVVVGDCVPLDGGQNAVQWKDGVMTILPMGGNLYTLARDINTRGQIVGAVVSPTFTGVPALWEDGVLHELPNLPGGSAGAESINDAGQVAGTSSTSASP